MRGLQKTPLRKLMSWLEKKLNVSSSTNNFNNNEDLSVAAVDNVRHSDLSS